jgi:uncharacterized phosphosugar-binding protein
MFLETQSGLAERILRNFHVTAEDSALIVSSSGGNTVPVEMAELLRDKQVKVVALVSRQHAEATTGNHPQGRRLHEVADLALDTGAPRGDAMVSIAGLATPVSPGSTVGGCLVINALKAEVAARLTAAGAAPLVLTAANVAGKRESQRLFEAAYDEHGRRLAQVLSHPAS